MSSEFSVFFPTQMKEMEDLNVLREMNNESLSPGKQPVSPSAIAHFET